VGETLPQTVAEEDTTQHNAVGVQRFWAGGWIFSGSSFFQSRSSLCTPAALLLLLCLCCTYPPLLGLLRRVSPPPARTWPGVCALQGKETAAAILTEAWAALWGQALLLVALRASLPWSCQLLGEMDCRAPPPLCSTHPFIWLRGERRCWLYTRCAESGSEHDCHLKAFTRKLRRGASSCAQLGSDLLVVCSRRVFFFLKAERQLFVKGGLQNVPLWKHSAHATGCRELLCAMSEAAGCPVGAGQGAAPRLPGTQR